MGEPFDKGSLDDLYRPPGTSMSDPAQLYYGSMGEVRESAKVLRSNLLPVETTIRTIGTTYLLNAGFSLVGIAVAQASNKFIEVINQSSAALHIEPSKFRTVVMIAMLFGTSLNLVLGFGLRARQNWARWIVIVFGVLSLLGKIRYLINPVQAIQSFVPNLETFASLLGSILSIVILFLLFLPGAAEVCSRTYSDVIAESREFRPRNALRDDLLLGAYLFHGLLAVGANLL